VNKIDPPNWRKSTRCQSGTCVEVAKVADQYLIRDSKRPDVSPLAFTEDEWREFVDGVNSGDFRF
jgi:hypothetical protein